MRNFGECLTSNDITLRHNSCDAFSIHVRHLTRREMYKFGGPFFEHRQTIQCFKQLPGSFYSNASKFTRYKEKMPNVRITPKKREQRRKSDGLSKSKKLTQKEELGQTEIEILRAENARLTERCLLLTERTTRLCEDYSRCIEDHAKTLEQLKALQNQVHRKCQRVEIIALPD